MLNAPSHHSLTSHKNNTTILRDKICSTRSFTHIHSHITLTHDTYHYSSNPNMLLAIRVHNFVLVILYYYTIRTHPPQQCPTVTSCTTPPEIITTNSNIASRSTATRSNTPARTPRTGRTLTVLTAPGTKNP